MDEFTGKIKPYLRIKALTIIMIMLLTTLKVIFDVVEPSAYLMGMLGSCLSAATGFWLWSAAARRPVAPGWIHASLIFDLLAITLGLYFYGGAQTTWGFTPIVIIIITSFLFDIRTTFIYCSLIFALLLGVYGAVYFNILSHQPAFYVPYAYWRNNDYLFDLLSGLFLLFTLITLASSYFNQKLRDAAERMSQAMADLARARTELEQRVQESAELFDNSPVALWEEDYNDLNAYLDGLKKSGVSDFAAYFSDNPDDLARCASLIRVLNVNRATLELYGAKTKLELADGLARVFTPESYEAFKRELIALAQGKADFESEAVNQTLSGGKIRILLKMTVLPDGRRVLISITDLTGQKKIEDDLQQRMKELKAFSDAAVGRELKMAEMEKELARLRELVRK